MFCCFSCLLNASYYLYNIFHLCCATTYVGEIKLYIYISTASGARYRRSACIDMDVLDVRQGLVVTWAKFQHNVVYYATEQCRKRLEACIHAEDGHSEHLL